MSEISGFILEGEINIKSLYFFICSNSSCAIGPIITLTPEDLNSFIAEVSLSLLLKPESLGTIKTFSSSISSKDNYRPNISRGIRPSKKV